MRIALYQPDIAQNTGTILRLGACLGVAVDIIEPAGFAATDSAFRRAGMDYLDHVQYRRHGSFAAFLAWHNARRGRLILATTRACLSYLDATYDAADTILFGRESAGAPQSVHDAADLRIAIPMQKHLRALNVAMATAMIAGEALRQTRGFPM